MDAGAMAPADALRAGLARTLPPDGPDGASHRPPSDSLGSLWLCQYWRIGPLADPDKCP